MLAGARGDRNLTPLGRVDEQIGVLAGVSRDMSEKLRGYYNIDQQKKEKSSYKS
jgi:hypothetical protein